MNNDVKLLIGALLLLAPLALTTSSAAQSDGPYGEEVYVWLFIGEFYDDYYDRNCSYFAVYFGQDTLTLHLELSADAPMVGNVRGWVIDGSVIVPPAEERPYEYHPHRRLARENLWLLWPWQHKGSTLSKQPFVPILCNRLTGSVEFMEIRVPSRYDEWSPHWSSIERRLWCERQEGHDWHGEIFLCSSIPYWR